MAAPVQVDFIDNGFGVRVDSDQLLAALADVHAQATPHVEQLIQTYQPQQLPADDGPPAFALTKRHGHPQLWLHVGPHQYIT
ncbi:hypothetical protein CHLRE_11g467788v5 [Chlamydomonas reinhardtii]|uniref:Uncharacterized protein n=1 Tax=Chlamydomonas reinhardtii TaxID=3055 RepID=A0A2K3D808_CHLRE|nr:uncharacterized protein CHLRE_11g467788v5 [Chlamydomonas reinhardtii]PNW76668.1 hypothetical protein CHLRE_11g467788v5 [Chlamydomonas reinhardtii]